jgi:hypothetical protein
MNEELSVGEKLGEHLSQENKTESVEEVEIEASDEEEEEDEEEVVHKTYNGVFYADSMEMEAQMREDAKLHKQREETPTEIVKVE